MRAVARSIVGIALLADASGAAAWTQKSDKVYSCVDKQGHRLTADRPIVECMDREQRVLDPMGMERQRIGPSLSEQERAAQEAQRRKEAEAQARVAEARHRDRALVTRYPDPAAHNVERAAAIRTVDEVTAVAQKRVADLSRERAKFDQEMEFYRKDPSKAPMTLRRQIAELDDALAERTRFIANQDQEKRRVNQRFDAELAQLQPLWAARDAAMAGGSAPR